VMEVNMNQVFLPYSSKKFAILRFFIFNLSLHIEISYILDILSSKESVYLQNCYSKLKKLSNLSVNPSHQVIFFSLC